MVHETTTYMRDMGYHFVGAEYESELPLGRHSVDNELNGQETDPESEGESNDERYHHVYDAEGFQIKWACEGCGTANGSQKAFLAHQDVCTEEVFHAAIEEVEGPAWRTRPHARGGDRVTYAKMTIIDKDGASCTVCYDTGASNCVISHDFLQRMENVIFTPRCTSLKGIGQQKTLGWATFSFRVTGIVDGTPTMARLHAGAWVIEQISANLLLGQQFNVLNKADLLNSRGVLRFGACNGMEVPAQVYAWNPDKNRSIQSQISATIPPRSYATLPIRPSGPKVRRPSSSRHAGEGRAN